MRLLFSAEGLSKAGKRLDPFLKVLKQRPSGDWVPLFKTEVWRSSSHIDLHLESDAPRECRCRRAV